MQAFRQVPKKSEKVLKAPKRPTPQATAVSATPMGSSVSQPHGAGNIEKGGSPQENVPNDDAPRDTATDGLMSEPSVSRTLTFTLIVSPKPDLAPAPILTLH